MNKFLRRIVTPVAVFAASLGVALSMANQRDVVGAEAATTVSVGNDFPAVSGNFDVNFQYTSFKGGASTAPALNSGVIRLYQNGGYITVSSRVVDYKITSLTINNSGVSDGQGPFTAHYISSGEAGNTDPTEWTQIGSGNLTWTGTAYTYANPAGFTHFKLVATGTTSKTRVYVDSISITYDYFGGAAVPVSGISIDDNIESLSLIERTSQQLTSA